MIELDEFLEIADAARTYTFECDHCDYPHTSGHAPDCKFLVRCKALRTEVSRLEAENLQFKKLMRDVNSYAEWYIEANTPVTIYTNWKKALNV